MIKMCRVHGALTQEQVHKRKVSKRIPDGGYYWECKACRKLWSTRGNKSGGNLLRKKEVDLLLPRYVKDRLRHAGFTTEDVTPELIQMKSAMLLLHRKIMERKKNAQTNQSK